MTGLDRLLDFAARSRLPDGGFGYLGDDGRVLPDRPVETWIVARMTHVFGLAHLLGRPGADELVRHGVAALSEGPLRDAEHGGWRASTDDDIKAAYVHAFVVLAGSTATAAGVAGGPALLRDALDVWQRRFWDDAEGMAVEEWDRGWTTCADVPRGQREHARRRGDAGRRGRGLRRGRRRPAPRPGAAHHRARRPRLGAGVRLAPAGALHRPVGTAARLQPRPAGRPLPALWRDDRAPVRMGASRAASPRRPRQGVYGHKRPCWLLDDAVALFDAAAARGWAADGSDGFPYTLDWDDRPVVGARMHWVLCEAVAAATVLAAVTGEPRYRALARRWRDHGEAVFADPATGKLAPRAHAGRPGRERHLGRAARRLPPGPDAAVRRPSGPRQHRGRAALAVLTGEVGQAADGRVTADTGVGPMVVVGV